MPKPAEIKSAVQLLVEGNDQRNFFEAFTSHLSIANVQIQNFGGVSQLRDFLEGFVGATGFRETVQSLGIVRDAETCAGGAFQSVQSALSNAALPMPNSPAERTDTSPAVTVLILPGDSRQGMLETLLCQSFAGDPVDHCIDDFFKCVESLPDVSIERSEKARAHAYLTTKPNPYFSVGVAAKNDYWDLDHSVFSAVRDFLQMIAASTP